MSEATERAGGSGPRAGESARSIVYLNVVAVTIWFEGGENRKPGVILKVYVRPSGERDGQAAAISGTSRQPSGAGASG